MKMITLFLGGTTDNDYRPGFIETLRKRGLATEKIFNPVVEHWGKAEHQREDEMKASPAVLMLYYIAGNNEGMFLSVYSLFEAVTGLYDAPERTVVVFNYTGLVPKAAKRVQKICKDLRTRFPRAPIFESLTEAEEWLIGQFV